MALAMPHRRQAPEQIIRKLAEGQKLLAGGMTIEDVCRQLGIAEPTWARSLSQYGGMKRRRRETSERTRDNRPTIVKYQRHRISFDLALNDRRVRRCS